MTNISDIDLKSLEILEALVAEKNVTRAAQRVGLSQPAVSHALAKLRDQLGDPLLIRTRSGMVPTSRAEGLVGPIQEVKRILTEAIEPSHKFDPATADNHFRISATDYAEWFVLPHLAKQLETTAPKLRLQFEPLAESVPLRDLERGEIDLAIGYFPEAPDTLYQQELFMEDFVCVMGPQSKVKTMDLKTFLSLRHLLVAPWGGMASLVDSILARKGKSRTVCVSTSHFLIAPTVVSETDSVVTLPRRVAMSFKEDLKLKVYEVPVDLPEFRFKQIWHKRAHHEPAHKWVRTQVREAVPK